MTTLRERLPDPPDPHDFTSPLRSPAVAARVGLWLGICFGICFVTGLISHYAQNINQPVPFPTSPAWGYRVTQGLHVTTGIASLPLLLVKLWSVYPKLFERPPSRRLGALAVVGLEKASIALLVSSSLFLLTTGLINITRWYPWDFSFRSTHYAVAWVAIGSLVIHIAVKLPIIRQALGADVDDTSLDRAGQKSSGPLSRRALLYSTWGAAALATIATVGQTVPFLRRVSVLAPRSGEGPGGIPINRTAREAGVTAAATRSGWTLEIVHGDTTVQLDLAQLRAMEQRTETLPIACVEGWSASGDWRGVRLTDLLDLVEAPRGRDVTFSSLQTQGAFGTSVLQSNFAEDPRTLLALELNGSAISLDHGFPCRLIAPNRPGVRQTKWVDRIEVQA